MHPFKKLIYSLRNENTSPLTRFCFSGYWSVGDPLHPFGGYVMYIDQYGDTQTLDMIFQEYEASIMAVSIINYFGCEPVTCDTGVPPPAYYTYDVSTLTSNNAVTACTYSPNMSLYTAAIPLIVGVQYFSDALLTTPFNGSSLYRSFRDGGTMKKIKISSTGYLMEISNC
jgi:hypothetical protein